MIAERAARHLKPVFLELGGKAPLIVLDDAGVDAAAFSAFMNHEQICMFTERIVIDDQVADEFVQKLAKKAASLSIRNPSEGPAVLGALVDRSSATRISQLIEDAVRKGAIIVAGGTATEP